jgi:Protein of unknown function (DUF3619)
MNRQTANEIRFAYKVKQALYESTEQIPADRLERLAAARKAALQKQKPERTAPQWNTRAAHSGAQSSNPTYSGEPGWFSQVALAFCLTLLIGGSVVGLYVSERDNRINDLAEIDSGVLIDTLPISAYADHGFNAYLQRTALRAQ